MRNPSECSNCGNLLAPEGERCLVCGQPVEKGRGFPIEDFLRESRKFDRAGLWIMKWVFAFVVALLIYVAMTIVNPQQPDPGPQLLPQGKLQLPEN